MQQFLLWFREGLTLTAGFLKANKIRSLLSVLGVTIGIFSIVAVLTLTTSLEKNIRSSIEKLGDNVIYIQKWPWVFGTGFKWWDYINRPEPTIKEYRRFAKESNPKLIQMSAFYFEFGNNKVKSAQQEISSLGIAGIEGSYFDISQWPIEYGREFTRVEMDKGHPVVIVGYELAKSLFPNQNPLNRRVKLNGMSVTIIGVLEKQGNTMGGKNYDELLMCPSSFAYNFNRPGKQGASSIIVVKGQDRVDLGALDFEINRIMRSIRKLRPKDKNDFAINKLTMFSDGLNQTFGVINLVGWLVGGFSLLVGGFGIANIMFVSVKERTSIIGLQKALGAKRRFIIMQFLIESVLLCLVGALIGILAVVILGTVVSAFSEFAIHQSLSVITQGTLVAVIIGLLAGLIPAYAAARMDPVEALRK